LEERRDRDRNKKERHTIKEGRWKKIEKKERKGWREAEEKEGRE
jgi:hypothetical protein